MATISFISCKKQNAFSIRNEIEYILQDFKVYIEPEKIDCEHTVNYQTYSVDADKTGCIRLIPARTAVPKKTFKNSWQPKTALKRLTKRCSITTIKPLRMVKPGQ